MSQRQHGYNMVARTYGEHLMAICNIGPKAAIGEHDPFGISRGARSIVYDSQFFG